MSGESLLNTRLDPSGPVLIVSDIHANWPALEAVIRAEPDSATVICLGDLVRYGNSPAECVRWVSQYVERQSGCAVKGNHDWSVARGVPLPYSRDRRLAQADIAHTRASLSPAEHRFLGTLPESASVQVGRFRWHLCHGIPSDPLHGYLFSDADEALWLEEVRLANEPAVLLVGHTHRPFIRRVGDTNIVNPGSVGRPKDGDPRASYAVFENGAFLLKRVAFLKEVPPGVLPSPE